MRIANKIGELESVRLWVEGFGATHNLSPRVLTSLLVSFDEVLNNLISYGYADQDRHEIVLRLALDESAVSGEIEDDGVPYDPLVAGPPKLEGGIAERPVGGLGIHFLRTLNDEVTYQRNGKINWLRFQKRFVNAP